MNVAEQIPSIDQQAAELARKIEYHQKARDVIYARLCRKLEYRDRKIRELSATRSEKLIFTLPSIDLNACTKKETV